MKVNLFNISRVKQSVAIYATMDLLERGERIGDPLTFCFGDVWGRCEYEFVICPWPYKDEETIGDTGQKIDTFTLYVEPNRDLLLSMVNDVSVSSAKKYLSEYRKKYRR